MASHFPLARFDAYRRKVLRTLAAAAVMPASLVYAQTGAFPNKPVTIVVPSTPGGLLDVIARLIGPKLTQYWGGVPVIVENEPGAAMVIGTRHVAKSAADGYTLLIGLEGAVVINPIVVADTPYATKDLEPLAQVWDTGLILVLNKDVPATTLPELDAYIKKNPGKLNYAVVDITGELVSAMISQAMGWELVDVRYKGQAERLRSIVSGETQMTLATASDAIAAVKTGRTRALGISSRTRSARLPDIPTLDEVGMKNFVYTTWAGMFAPAGTPAPIAAKLSGDLRRALTERDVVQRVEAGGTELAGQITRDQFKQRIAADAVRWRQMAQSRGMKTYGK